MPIRRTRRRTRRRRPRGGGKAMRAVRTLSKFVDRELHHTDFVNTVGVTSAGVILLMTAIAQNDSPTGRSGIQATFRSLRLSQHIVVGNNDVTMRVTLLVDKHANGALPGLALIYQNVTTPQQVMVSPFENDFSKRFTPLVDRVMRLDNVQRVHWNWGKRRRLTHKGRWSAGGAGIADVISGNVLLIMTATTVGGANSPTVQTSGRFRFAP